MKKLAFIIATLPTMTNDNIFSFDFTVTSWEEEK